MTEHLFPLAFGLIFTVIGGAFAVAAFADWRRYRKERATAFTTDGVVVSVEKITYPHAEFASSRYAYRPLLRFVGRDGDPREASTAIEHRSYDFAIGETLRILQPEGSDPGHIAESRAMDKRSFVSGVFGTGSLVLGVICLAAVLSDVVI